MRKILSVATILTVLLAAEEQAQAKFELPEFLQKIAAKLTRKSPPACSHEENYMQELEKRNIKLAADLSHQHEIAKLGKLKDDGVERQLSYIHKHGLVYNTRLAPIFPIYVFMHEVVKHQQADHKVHRPYIGGKAFLEKLFTAQTQSAPVQAQLEIDVAATKAPESQIAMGMEKDVQAMKTKVLNEIEPILQGQEIAKRAHPLSSLRALKGLYNNAFLSSILANLGSNPLGTVRVQPVQDRFTQSNKPKPQQNPNFQKARAYFEGLKNTSVLQAVE